MSLNTELLSCPRCKAYLFEEDDVVYCPVCGAPHHRACYNALGHCALEALHGTDKQYSKEKELEKLSRSSEPKQEQPQYDNISYATCGMCGERYPSQSRACPKCKTPNMDSFSGFGAFDMLGGVPKDYKLDENVTADEAKRFVVSNTHRYIPKFATLSKSNRVSWNWFAFLFPSGWMLSRKMFKNGIITGVLAIVATLLSYPLSNALYSLGLSSNLAYTQLVSSIYEALPNIPASLIVFSLIGMAIDLFTRLFSAIFGDYLYKKYAVEQIKKIKLDSADLEYDFRKKGGVNILFFFLATLALQYIPVILISII